MSEQPSIQTPEIAPIDGVVIGRAMERAGFDTVEDFARIAVRKLTDEILAHVNKPTKQPA